MKKKIQKLKLYHFALRFPLFTLLLCIGFALFSLHLSKKLKVDTDVTALLPQNSESVRALKLMQEQFGGLGYLLIVAESNEASLTQSYLKKLNEKVEVLPEVQYSDHKKSGDFFSDHKWLYLEKADLEEMKRRLDRTLELQQQGISPIFNDLVDFADEENKPDIEFKDIRKKYEDQWGDYLKAQKENTESSFGVLRLKLKFHPQEMDLSKSFMEKIREIDQQLKKENPLFNAINLQFSGGYQQNIEQIFLLNSEIFVISSSVALCLFLILILYFRKISAAFIVCVALLIGILWTGGLIYFFLGHVNIVTGFAGAILAGLGSDYGIYLLTRYFQEREEGKTFKEACDYAFTNTGRATRASMITTVAAFLALLFSDFKFCIEFGFVGALGVFVNYIAMMLVMPSILSLLERIPYFQVKKQGGLNSSFNFSKTTVFRTLFIPQKPYLLLCLVLGFILLSAYQVYSSTTIFFEDGRLDGEKLPSASLNLKIAEHLGSSISPTLLITPKKEEEKTTQQLNDYFKNQARGELNLNVVGPSSFIPKDQKEKKEILKEIYALYQKVKIPAENTKKDLLNSIRLSMNSKSIEPKDVPLELSRVFETLDPNGPYTAVFLLTDFKSESGQMSRKMMEDFAGRVLDAKKQLGLNFLPVDIAFIAHDTLGILEKEGPKLLFYILLFLFVVLLFVIKGYYRPVIIHLQLLASLLFVFVILWLMNIPLNSLNIAVVPIILGTGIDSFIHFGLRYDETKNLSVALETKVVSIIVSNITTLVGFGGLIFTSSYGLRSLGWMAVWGMIVTTAFCVWVFPRLIQLEERLLKK